MFLPGVAVLLPGVVTLLSGVVVDLLGVGILLACMVVFLPGVVVLLPGVVVALPGVAFLLPGVVPLVPGAVVLIPGAVVLLHCMELKGGSATTLTAIVAELCAWTEEPGVGRRCGTVVVPGTCKVNHLVRDRKEEEPLEIHDVRVCPLPLSVSQ